MTAAEKYLYAPLPKGPISEIIVKRITDCLINGELKPGDKIPTEVEFSKHLSIGRNGVREAIKVLAAFGVLEVRRSEGTFIVEHFSQALLDPMLYGLIFARDSMPNMLEFKISFLQTALYLALKKADDSNIRKLRAMYEHLKDTFSNTPEDIDTLYKVSVGFHKYLCDICKNPLLTQMNDSVLKISKYSRTIAFQKASQGNKSHDLIDTYRWIVELLEKKDTTGLYDVIEKIMAVWKKLLLQ
jgi:GntR family transcriptional repressor for pyruvate dehydrogenase complex